MDKYIQLNYNLTKPNWLQGNASISNWFDRYRFFNLFKCGYWEVYWQNVAVMMIKRVLPRYFDNEIGFSFASSSMLYEENW